MRLPYIALVDLEEQRVVYHGPAVVQAWTTRFRLCSLKPRTHFWFVSIGTARLFHGARVLLTLSQITLQPTFYLATSLPTQQSFLCIDKDPDIDSALFLTSNIYMIRNLHNHVLLELVGKNCHFGLKETPRGD
ncbi:hypothetical protein TNCV_1213761 [Trichonephila clavipes]|nr:hypothetical protein TNCV_1213761 [Trichonephila clavipes]